MKGGKESVILERIEGLKDIVELKTEGLCERIDDVKSVFAEHDKRDIERHDAIINRLGKLETKAAVSKVQMTAVSSGIATVITLMLTNVWDKITGKSL